MNLDDVLSLSMLRMDRGGLPLVFISVQLYKISGGVSAPTIYQCFTRCPEGPSEYNVYLAR